MHPALILSTARLIPMVAQFEGLQAKGIQWGTSFLALLTGLAQLLGTIALVIVGLAALWEVITQKSSGGDVFGGSGSSVGAGAKKVLIALVLIGAAGFLAQEALNLGQGAS
jgi:hypothetical protein